MPNFNVVPPVQPSAPVLTEHAQKLQPATSPAADFFPILEGSQQVESSPQPLAGAFDEPSLAAGVPQLRAEVSNLKRQLLLSQLEITLTKREVTRADLRRLQLQDMLLTKQAEEKTAAINDHDTSKEQ